MPRIPGGCPLTITVIASVLFALGLGTVSGLPAAAVTTPAGVAVTWTNTNVWTTGFQSDVALRNTSTSTLNPWQVAFTYAHTVNTLWNGVLIPSVGGFAVRAPTWSRSLAPGASTSFGLTSRKGVSTSLVPISCRVIGLPAGSAPIPCSVNGVAAPLPTATPTPTPTPTPVPSPSWTPLPPASGLLVAPYVDLGLWPTADLSAFAATTGVKALTGSFIVADRSSSCSPTWAGYTEYAVGTSSDFRPNITAFQSGGGQFIASFGGSLNNELARVCTNPSTLLSAYTKVVTRFNLSRIDFDIEGTDVSDSVSNQRRAAAVAALQVQRAAAGHPLQVSLTLPVMPSGLVASGVRTVSEFAAAGVRLSAVNVMAMDYGDGTRMMGTAAIAAAQATATQLGTIPTYAGLTSAQRLSLVGLTPMIGQNDVPGEIFTPTDATLVGQFATTHSLASLGWWEMTRDQPCTSATPSYMCSGVTSAQWTFSRAFVATTR